MVPLGFRRSRRNRLFVFVFVVLVVPQSIFGVVSQSPFSLCVFSRCVAINLRRCVAIAMFRCLMFSRYVAITLWRCVATAARAQMVLPIGRGISARRGRGSFLIAAQRARSYAALREAARDQSVCHVRCARD